MAKQGVFVIVSLLLVLVLFIKMPKITIVFSSEVYKEGALGAEGGVQDAREQDTRDAEVKSNDPCYCASSISRNKVDSIGGWNYNEVTIKSHHVWFDAGLGKDIIRMVVTNTPAKENGMKPTIADIGAGVGQFGAWLLSEKDSSISWHGFDGGSNVNDFCGKTVALIDRQDYMVPKVCFLDASVPINVKDLELDGAPFDWVMSIEVAEHIPADYQLVLIDNLIRLSKYGIIMSWAIPGQGGHGHVNERTNQEVIEMMRLRNMYYLPNESNNIRKRIDRLPWLRNTVMVFSKFEGIDTTEVIQ